MQLDPRLPPLHLTCESTRFWSRPQQYGMTWHETRYRDIYTLSRDRQEDQWRGESPGPLVGLEVKPLALACTVWM